MGMMRRTLLIAATCLWSAVCIAADANEETAASNERWAELQKLIFPNRSINDGAAVIQLDAPPRAMDAALVPFTITLPGEKQIKSVFLIIDNNPGPLAAHFTFGPA